MCEIFYTICLFHSFINNVLYIIKEKTSIYKTLTTMKIQIYINNDVFYISKMNETYPLHFSKEIENFITKIFIYKN